MDDNQTKSEAHLEVDQKRLSIKAIDSKTVHRICSGQVILTLANAVKELLENSLDARSTSIEIRLIEYGIQLIEVVDNGVGIQKIDFPAITLKHYTSKLSNFEDLVLVGTYGFRGEALSSLCALGDVTVTTKHKDASVGTKLELDHDGKIVKDSVVPRQMGTTVSVKNLFSSLPVRHKEFIKNIKKEFSKMLQCLYGYCLIADNVKIVCSNKTQKSKNILISSEQNVGTKERISSIFGIKQTKNLMEIRTCAPSDEILEEFNLKDIYIESNQVDICGFISSSMHGSGRSSADRQFYFINKRPCDLPKVSKLVNALYHFYNRHQFPFVMLDISLNKNMVDINVTPNKRSLFLDKENVFLATVKSSLKILFDSESGLLELSMPSSSKTLDEAIDVSDISTHDEQKLQLNESFGNVAKDNVSMAEECEIKEEIKFVSPVKRKSIATSEMLSGFKRKQSLNPSTNTPSKKSRSLNDYFFKINTCKENLHKSRSCNDEKASPSVLAISVPTVETVSLEDLPGGRCESMVIGDIGRSQNTNVIVETDIMNASDTVHADSLMTFESHAMPFSMQLLKKYYERKTNDSNSSTLRYRKFKAKIDPSSNEQAESELKKQLTKEMFKKMKIIGQFNLGFIITELDDELFIIDQHATDEKYNYEDLKKNVVLQTQKLIVPRPLILGAANEILLSDNLGIFHKNGFVISNVEDSRQLCLIGVPVSKNWTFGKEDIEEMLFMMSDGVISGEMYRPSRIQQMLASRACRKSVMIGTALNVSTMKKLVVHMAAMDQPWNCPHGRPTIRHLINIKSIKS
ncbi:Mismatch repair endonuclease pms2 [Chamberlinius hualienensis]